MQFRNLTKQYECLKTQIDNAISNVLQSSNFISGEPVKKLEKVLIKMQYEDKQLVLSEKNKQDALQTFKGKSLPPLSQSKP